MTNDTHGSETPSDEHILLARILERQRGSDARREVDNILESKIPVRDKVSRINDIDRRYTDSVQGDEAFEAVDLEEATEPRGRFNATDYRGGVAADEAGATRHAALSAVGIPVYTPVGREPRREIARRRARIKAAPSVNGFWNFILHQRRPIKGFLRQTQFLRFSFFGFSLQMNPDARARVNEWITKEIPPLLEALNPILQEGWIVLSKLEYNAIHLLYELVMILNEDGIPRTKGRPGSGTTRYSVIERDLLVLHRVDRDGALLISGIERFYAVNRHDGGPDTRRLGASIRTLLDEERSPYGLAGYIRAINMAANARFFVLADITIAGTEELIPAEYFECSTEVGAKIAEYLETIVTRINIVSRRLRELSRIELYANTNTKNAEDDGENAIGNTVWKFAQQASNSDVNVAGETNMLVRATHLMNATRREISPILDGVTALSGGVGVTVFIEQCFGAEVSRIHRIYREIEKIRYDFPSFPVERFFKVHRKMEEPSIRERQAVDLIEEYAEIMVRIGKRLTLFTGNRREAAGSTDTFLMPYTPVTFGRPFVAPEIEQLIAGNGRFSGGSILDAITAITEISLTIGRYFEEKTILSEMREAVAYRNELRSLMPVLQRIATTEVYEAVRSTIFVGAGVSIPST